MLRIRSVDGPAAIREATTLPSIGFDVTEDLNLIRITHSKTLIKEWKKMQTSPSFASTQAHGAGARFGWRGIKRTIPGIMPCAILPLARPNLTRGEIPGDRGGLDTPTLLQRRDCSEACVDSDIDLVVGVVAGHSLLDRLAFDRDMAQVIGRPMEALFARGLPTAMERAVLIEGIPL